MDDNGETLPISPGLFPSPWGEGKTGKRIGENLPTKYRQRTRRSLTAQSAQRATAREHYSPGAKAEKRRLQPPLPPGRSCRARSPEGDRARGNRRPAQGTDRAGTEQGRPNREPAAEWMARKGTARAASGEERVSAHEARANKPGERPGARCRLGRFAPDRHRDSGSGRAAPEQTQHAERGRVPDAECA